MNPATFKVGDKVATTEDGKGMVIVPYLRPGRVYTVRKVIIRRGVQRICLVGHRLHARYRGKKWRMDDSLLAEYFYHVGDSAAMRDHPSEVPPLVYAGRESEEDDGDEEDDTPQGMVKLPTAFVAIAEAAGVDPQLLAGFVLSCMNEVTAQMGKRWIERARWEIETAADLYPRDVRSVSCREEAK